MEGLEILETTIRFHIDNDIFVAVWILIILAAILFAGACSFIIKDSLKWGYFSGAFVIALLYLALFLYDVNKIEYSEMVITPVEDKYCLDLEKYEITATKGNKIYIKEILNK